MARTFAHANPDFITLSSLPALSSAVSFSCWINNTTTPGGFPTRFTQLISEANNAANVNYAFIIDNTPSITMYYTTSSNVFVNFVGTVGAWNTGAWHSLVVSSDFTTAGTTIYLDGSAASMSTSGTPGTPEQISTGFFIGCSIGNNQDSLNGTLADVGLWSVKLTAGEAKALSQGARPYTVRSSSLKGYWPLDGIASPEPDLSGSKQNGTLTGTTLAAGPPMMMFTPRGARFESTGVTNPFATAGAPLIFM